MSKLEEILAYKKEELAASKKEKPVSALEKELKHRDPVRPFAQAISRPGKVSLIAEFKRASPSAGPIRAGADPAGIARAYEAAGAQAISVLTDRKFFSGALADLRAARGAASLPVLRKDFTLEEYHVVEAAAGGADAVLLIAAALPPPALKRLLALAKDMGLSPLVEVHSERELDQALEADARLIGINNRDLSTFTVDLKTTQRLIGRMPPGRTVVSESGIKSREDVEWIRGLGASAVLVGEELMSSPDVGKRVKELMGCG